MESGHFLKKTIGRIGAIRRIATIAGISFLSALPSNTHAQELPVAGTANAKNIEYTRQELEDEKILFNVAWKILYKDAGFYDHEEFGKLMNWYSSLTNKDLEELKSLNLVPFSGSYSSKEDLLRDIWTQRKKEFDENIPDWEESIIPRIDVERKMEDIRKLIFYYDFGRQWVLDNIKTEEYQRRFMEELKYYDHLPSDPSKLKQDIKEQIARRITQASDGGYILSEDINKSKMALGDSSGNAIAFYHHHINKPYFPLKNDDLLDAVASAIHEYIHKVTSHHGATLSSNSIELFKKAFFKTNTLLFYLKKGATSADTLRVLNYYGDPYEMYARKKVFDRDLERLGIKKYGDEFTNEHYYKAKELFDKLSKDSKQFLRIINPSYMLRVMNEIANVDLNEKFDSKGVSQPLYNHNDVYASRRPKDYKSGDRLDKSKNLKPTVSLPRQFLG